MKRKVVFGLLGAALVLGLSFTAALAPSGVWADQPAKVPPVQGLEMTDEGLQVRFTASITPIFEGGAQGQPFTVPVQVVIKTGEVTHLPLKEQLPEQVKRALQSALTDDLPLGPTKMRDTKLDNILEQLARIERRLQKVEQSVKRASPE